MGLDGKDASTAETHPPDTLMGLLDPAPVGRSMADVAERSQRIVADWLNQRLHRAPGA